jgi:hypothetical protein
VFEREDSTDYQDVHTKNWYMKISIYVNYGIKDLLGIKKNGSRSSSIKQRT